jgi:uncharacterized membrane protein
MDDPAQPPADPTRPPPPAGSYFRGDRGLEFDRVSIFSDAVFAISLTLLVVALKVPDVPDGETDAAALAAALQVLAPNMLGFFLGFALLGRYWLAHHEFFAGLRSIDKSLIRLNLIYLAFVAFMPFPVAILSEYERNEVSYLLFAVALAVVSLLEMVMFVLAVARRHTREEVSPATLRFGLIASGAPVAAMLLSIPAALVDTDYALAIWLALLPVGAVINRLDPEGRRRRRGN